MRASQVSQAMQARPEASPEMSAVTAHLQRTLVPTTGAVCAAIGMSHVLFGARTAVGDVGASADEDSQERFLGALFTGYGAALLWAARQRPLPVPLVRFLAGTMALGGVGRVLSIAERGRPHPFWVAMTAVEFAVPAALVWAADADRAGER